MGWALCFVHYPVYVFNGDTCLFKVIFNVTVGNFQWDIFDNTITCTGLGVLGSFISICILAALGVVIFTSRVLSWGFVVSFIDEIHIFPIGDLRELPRVFKGGSSYFKRWTEVIHVWEGFTEVMAHVLKEHLINYCCLLFCRFSVF